MNAQELLDQLLQSGKKLAEQGWAQSSELVARGKDLLADGADDALRTLRIPEAGPERDQMLKHLGVGAAAGGLLALLLGTQGGRRTLSRVAKVGSLAALGGLGYKIYSDYQKTRGEAAADTPDSGGHDRSNSRCLMIVQSMIAAAKADGQIDAGERGLIEERIRDSELEASVIHVLLSEIQKPLIVEDVVAMAKTPMDGVDIYLASLLVLDSPSPPEQSYLSQLASALDLDPALVRRLESEAFRPV